MTDYNDGQIHGWNGGECPVHPKTVVEVWFRCKDSDICQANALFWNPAGECDDIVAFRVVEPYVESKVIWVNEYPEELAAHHNMLSAINSSTPRATRIAVKYVEARDD